MRFLSMNSTFYRLIVRFWDMVKLNVLWVIFSLPIVTIGASTVAAYSVTLRMVDDSEGDVAKQFINSFKENWRQGIFLGIMSTAACYFVYLNLEFFNKLETSPITFLFAAIIISFLSLLYLTYAFPLCARYHNSLIGILKNSSAIALRYFVRTFALWLVIVVLILLFMFNTTLMFFGALIGPVSIFLTVSGFASKFFKEIEAEV